MRLWFKCENLQRVGAFKARGAFHAIERLKQDADWVRSGGEKKGVVTHSSGELRGVPFFQAQFAVLGQWSCRARNMYDMGAPEGLGFTMTKQRTLVSSRVA
jgi:hypothetical protein